MCGIAGFTRFRFRPDDSRQVIMRMTRLLEHRGPDDEGFYESESICLGHRRLSIIDLTGGHQPMTLERERYALVFNGEIYNYVELREELERAGDHFTTHSDTEVLLHLLVKEGTRALDKLNGMFAFAFWDRSAGRLLLARDRLGIKPLYYALVKGELVFASELRALLDYPGVERRIDLLSLSKYLSFGYIPAPHTIFEGIHKLEPGFYLVFDGREVERCSYWDIPIEDHPVSGKNLDECAQDLLELLRDSIRLRLRSDVPVGVFLSGGIDSSTITALAAEVAGHRLHTFSVGFEESSYDESGYARMVADRFGTIHHHEVLSVRRALELIPQVVVIPAEPFGDASIIPTYLLSRFTRAHVKVALGGDGGDELFAGYPSFQAHKIMEKLSFLPVSWRDAFSRLARRLPVSHRYASIDFLIQQFLRGAGISPEIRFFLWMGCFGNDQKRSLLTPEVQHALLRRNPFEDVINYVRQSGLVSDFERILYLCMKLYLQDDILLKVDRASMANSLEVRVPFLDHNLVEYMSGVQSVYKLKGLTTKYVLKFAVRHLLPRAVIRRRKAGFMIPLAAWLARDLRDLLEEVCSESVLRRDGLFDASYVQQMIRDHVERRRDYRKQLWTLLCFQLWRQSCDGSVTWR